MTSFEKKTRSAYNLTDEKNSFSIIALGQWTSKDDEENFDKLYKLLERYWSSKVGGETFTKLKEILELGSQIDIDLHVEEVEKRGTRREKGNSGHSFASFDLFKREIVAELRRVKYKDPDHIVSGMELPNDEIVDLLEIKFVTGPTNGYTLPPGINKDSDRKLMLKSLLPNEVKVNNRNDDIR